MDVLTGQLNRSERKNVLLLPGKMGAAETGGLMYLRRESEGRSRDEAVEILFSLGFGLEFGRLVQQLLSGLLPQSFLLRAIIRWICGRGGRLGDVLSLQRWAIPARHDLTRCKAHGLFAAHSSKAFNRTMRG